MLHKSLSFLQFVRKYLNQCVIKSYDRSYIAASNTKDICTNMYAQGMYYLFCDVIHPVKLTKL